MAGRGARRRVVSEAIDPRPSTRHRSWITPLTTRDKSTASRARGFGRVQGLQAGSRKTSPTWWNRSGPGGLPQEGSLHNKVELPGGRRRIHLRIEPGGRGVLFVDVTDIIYLNPTAAEMAPLLVRVRDHAAGKGMRFLWYTPTEYCRMSPVEFEIGAKRCNAGEYSICIEPNGDVLPCQSYYVSAGNVLRDPWDVIWNGELFRSFRDREDDPRKWGLPEKCWECPDLPLCGGGCRIEREAREGHRTAEGGGCSSQGGACCSSNPATSDATGDRFAPSAGLIQGRSRSTGLGTRSRN